MSTPGSQINFNGVILRRARFDDLDKVVAANASGKNFNVSLQVSSGTINDDRHAFVRVEVTVVPAEEPNLFSELQLTMDGLFSIPAEGNPSDLMAFANASGPSLLMPYVRQAITNLTAFTRGGLVLLPPMNLTRLMAEQGVAVPIPGTNRAD